MIYIEYEEYKNKYYNAQNEYDKILSKKEKLFLMTQPSATDYSKEPISGGSPTNTFEEYLIQKDKQNIDEKLKEAFSILKDREMLLKLKKEELEQSKDWEDIIYKYSYIYKLSSRKIENRTPFSKTEICRKLEIIKKNLGQKGTKAILK